MEGFYSVTLEGKLLIYNDEFTRIFGLDPDKDYTGLELPDFWQNPEDRKDYINELKLIGFIRNYIIKAKKANGEKITVQANSRLVKDEEGRPVRIEGTILDITEKMRIEAELERFNRELTRKNEELEQVLYATSHDLRSPLLNIQGFSRELQVSISELNSLLKNQEIPLEIWDKCRGIIEEDILEDLNYILLSSSKMDLILSGLLSLSRIGRQKLIIKNLDMGKIIKDVVSTYEYEIQEKNIKLNISQLPMCRGDELLINQLFSNLVGNAVKFIDPDRIALIKISGKKEKDRVLYSIKDNGIGISPEHKNKIFELFHQLNPNITGTGLGLTIVKQILEKHGGDIQVDSELGKGTRFTVSLP
jgi:PAS domain S-box-containing protein